MLGLICAAVVLTVLGGVMLKVCLTAQPCKTRTATRKQVVANKPMPDASVPEKADVAMRIVHRVGAGAITLLSRRNVSQAPVNVWQPLQQPQIQHSELRVKTSLAPSADTEKGRTLGLGGKQNLRDLPVRTPARAYEMQFSQSPSATSPRREPSLEQGVAHRKPLPHLEVNGEMRRGDADRTVERDRRNEQDFSERKNQSLGQGSGGTGPFSMLSPALHASQKHSHLSPQWNTQWNSPTHNLAAGAPAAAEKAPESGDRVAWAVTALNTDILLNPHAIYSGDKENDQPISDGATPQQQQQQQQQHAAVAAGNTSSLSKRLHEVSSSTYKLEAAPPPKRPSIREVVVLHQQLEKRYAALAKISSEDHCIAAALQAEINRVDASECGMPLRARAANVELPRSDEIDAACKVLSETLRRFGLRERNIVGDGNCQFRAVADQLFRSQDEHATIRERAVSQMRDNPELYSGFIHSETLEQYLNRMASPRSWGDNLTLQAIADTFDLQINVMTNFPDNNVIVVKSNECIKVKIWLGFYAEFHYVSVEPKHNTRS